MQSRLFMPSTSFIVPRGDAGMKEERLKYTGPRLKGYAANKNDEQTTEGEVVTFAQQCFFSVVPHIKVQQSEKETRKITHI